MSRTLRFCNKKHSPLFEHPFKFFRRHCRCSYCIDPESSMHRRERCKLEILRELANASFPHIEFPHRPCWEWHQLIYWNAPGNNCNMEIKMVSFKKGHARK